MAAQRRKSLAPVLGCDVMEGRLAPSGNFLSHGLADISRSVDHLGRHHAADHATADHEHRDAGAGMKVHYHHVVDGVAK